MSEEEAARLVGLSLLYVMVDSRWVIGTGTLETIWASRALKEMVMRDWVDLKGLRGVLVNIAERAPPDHDSFYGDYRMTNEMFLRVLRDKYSEDILKRLGMLNKPNRDVLEGLRVMAEFQEARRRKQVE